MFIDLLFSLEFVKRKSDIWISLIKKIRDYTYLYTIEKDEQRKQKRRRNKTKME